MTEMHLSLVPKEPLLVRRERTEEEIATYDAMRKVEDEMPWKILP